MSSARTHLPAIGGHLADARHGPLAHIAVLVHRGRLDRMLAEGADPSTSRELELRAAQLTRISYRRLLADSFERVLAMAQASPPACLMSAVAQPASREVRASRAQLLDLCHALREHAVVEAAGVALAKQLLTDGSSPLYVEYPNDALWHALRRAVVALDRQP